ncbi:hypothetical protein [Bradyrhizobium sp. ERR14]|uniref:hypothetical protein n=1 Tax=Bradyrhizobium sp. ERR14 TaxID=2663837 RepID=UPI0016210834|nr:hypothetical protein [Bradyrhizobium sp. ERR14]MBB4391755.1 hypothetical protein [Bradyrhizobium sp. ERR14]
MHAYHDKLAFWIERSFSEKEKDFIRRECGPGGTDLDREEGKRRARFNPKLIQRIETRQPSQDLLKFLSTVPGLYLNMVEFTLDLIFESEEDRDEMYQYLDRHLVKRNHRGEVRYVKRTRYTDRRWAPTNLVMYPPEFAKLTGEVYCLHLEFRVCGVRALDRMEIRGVTDLVNFDHHAFWAPRLLIKRIGDFARLGRIQSNGERRQRKHTPNKPRIYTTRRGFRYHTDARIGQTLWRAKETVQKMIDDARKKKIPVSRSLIPIDNRALLPIRKIEKSGNLNGSNGMGEANVKCLANKRTPSPIKPKIKRERLQS